MIKNFLKKRYRFSKSFPFIRLKKRNEPSLVIVKDLAKACVTDAEKLLYNELKKLSYYATPHYFVNGVHIHLALVPFRLALIEKKRGIDEARIVRQLKKRQWNVIFYDAKTVLNQDGVEKYVERILEYAPLQRISN